MILSKENVNSIEIVTVSGDIVFQERKQFKNYLQEIIKEGKTKIAIDLSECQYIDSSGLGILTATLKSVQSRKGNMFLITLNPNVRVALEVTELIRFFTVYDRKEDLFSESSS